VIGVPKLGAAAAWAVRSGPAVSALATTTMAQTAVPTTRLAEIAFMLA
jgi:hypothetical protein